MSSLIFYEYMHYSLIEQQFHVTQHLLIYQMKYGLWQNLITIAFKYIL